MERPLLPTRPTVPPAPYRLPRLDVHGQQGPVEGVDPPAVVEDHRRCPRCGRAPEKTTTPSPAAPAAAPPARPGRTGVVHHVAVRVVAPVAEAGGARRGRAQGRAEGARPARGRGSPRWSGPPPGPTRLALRARWPGAPGRRHLQAWRGRVAPSSGRRVDCSARFPAPSTPARRSGTSPRRRVHGHSEDGAPTLVCSPAPALPPGTRRGAGRGRTSAPSFPLSVTSAGSSDPQRTITGTPPASARRTA